jgi:cysteine desulfurase
MGIPYEYAHGSIRFSLGKDTTTEEVDYVLEILPGIVENLRNISPFNVDEKKLEGKNE